MEIRVTVGVSEELKGLLEGLIKVAGLKEASPKEASPKEASLKEASPKEASLKEASPKEASLKEASLKEASPKEASLKVEGAGASGRPRDEGGVPGHLTAPPAAGDGGHTEGAGASGRPRDEGAVPGHLRDEGGVPGHLTEGPTDEEMRTLIDITISRVCGTNDWKESQDGRVIQLRRSASQCFKDIAKALGAERPTALKGDARGRFLELLEKIVVKDGGCEVLPF